MLESIDRFDDCYQIIKNKKNNKITSFITVLVIILIIFLFYFFLYEYEPIKTYYGTITNSEDGSYIISKIKSNDFMYLVNDKNKLVIDNEEVNYEIVDFTYNNDYYEVIMKLQLKLEPRIIKLTFILNKTTLFKRIKEEIIYGKNFK